ncbi:MAG TPA: hypothetical protein PLC80_09180 [Draconibacterium sp.]|nr:hypothetical protein [Draconibacterium sp.]
MKNTFLFIIFILACTFANAQDSYQNDEVRTIFTKNKSNGGYGALTVAYSNIGGYDAIVAGARGAFIFDHSLAIGMGGYGFVNNLNYDYYHGVQEKHLSLTGGYGGFLIEPIIAGKSPVHLSFPVLIGAGGVALVDMYDYDYWDDNYSGYEYANDVFFVVEPAVELEFNLARFFRMAAAVSYRYTSNIDLKRSDIELSGQTKADALRGLNFGLTFKFGKF